MHRNIPLTSPAGFSTLPIRLSHRGAIASITRRSIALPALALLALPLLALAPASAAESEHAPSHPVTIDLDPAQSQTFRPDEVLGAAIDGAEKGAIDALLTRRNVDAMKSADLRPLTYRLRTELGIEAWHWNPRGTWSDPAQSQGYWTSSDKVGAPIQLSWGYRLPRRGDTIDNANDDDYSRLTDGDRATFWKSNPYLDPKVLKDGQDHPQWLIVRFDRSRPIDTAEIDWADPYALRYEIQYWTGSTDYDPQGRWVDFADGKVANGRGGEVHLHLSDKPVTTEYVRVLLLQGSGTAPPASHDWRDRAGFAVREVSFGTARPDGTLDDAVVHAASHKGQTFAHVSSTDPWHRASDRDKGLEQAGIDRIFASKLGFGLPVMMPTGLLYDTPENEAAELRYIARRHYPVTRIELGEEPDGQYASPADYGALYLAAVDNLKGIVPHARFGGPSLQSAFSDVTMLPEMPGSWNGWFVDYLKHKDRLADLGFVSFEFYPFDDICGDIHAKLIEQSRMLAHAARRFDSDGVPAGVPRIISEYGFSAYSGRAMSEMPSALLMAGLAGQWLSQGGDTAYMFGYGPNWPANQNLACAGYGNMMLFTADAKGQAKVPMPSYYTARLLTREWTLPGHEAHRILNAQIADMPGEEVEAFPVRRPDGKIAVLLVNRSPTKSFTLPLVAQDARGTHPLAGPGELATYGPAQYSWVDAGEESHPGRSEPPLRTALPAGPVSVTLPADSIAVVVVDGGTLSLARGN